MRRRIVIAVIVVAVVAGLGFFGLRQAQRARDTVLGDLQTAQVTRGSLVATISTAGTVEPASAVTLSFRSSGEVEEIKVEEGERVKAGQVLACLDARDAALAVAQAEVNLDIARARLDQLKKGASPEEIAAARASLASAQENLKALQAAPTAEELELARLRWEQAKDQLWGAQAQRDATCGNPHAAPSACDQANASVASAGMAAEIARVQYEQTQKGASERDLRAAEAQVAQAQLTLSKLEQGAASEEIRIAEAQVRQAELSLEQARLQLSPACLTAPFDGTVTHLNLHVGQVVGPTTQVATIAGLDALEIVADLSEIDVAAVELGQEVELRFDALPDQVFQGHVARLAATGTVVQGVVNYPVTIHLDEPVAAIRPGMSANASIIIDRRDNVLLVPNRTIRSQGGQYMVRVLRNGLPVDTPVQLGLSGDINSEVLGDTLKEGDTLIVHSASLSRMMGMSAGFSQ